MVVLFSNVPTREELGEVLEERHYQIKVYNLFVLQVHSPLTHTLEQQIFSKYFSTSSQNLFHSIIRSTHNSLTIIQCQRCLKGKALTLRKFFSLNYINSTGLIEFSPFCE